VTTVMNQCLEYTAHHLLSLMVVDSIQLEGKWKMNKKHSSAGVAKNEHI
jgi:hypothetical protein